MPHHPSTDTSTFNNYQGPGSSFDLSAPPVLIAETPAEPKWGAAVSGALAGAEPPAPVASECWSGIALGACALIVFGGLVVWTVRRSASP